MKAAGAAVAAFESSRLDSASPRPDRSVEVLEAEFVEVRLGYEMLEESFVRHRKAADDVAISMVRRAEEERKVALDQVKEIRKRLKTSHAALGLLQMASVLVMKPGRRYADGKVEYLYFPVSSSGGESNAEVILDASKNGNRAFRMPEPWKIQIAEEWGVVPAKKSRGRRSA